MTRTFGWSCLSIVLIACDSNERTHAASDTEYIGEDLPAGNCGETDDDEPCTSSSGGAAPSGCQASTECEGEEICAAGFDGEIGSFACRSTCIPDLDETRWCVDDQGCCGVDSVCQDRGYCVPSSGTDATTDGGATSTGDGATSSTGG
jgi:hypothetical protein